MSLESISIPPVGLDPRHDGVNMFASFFGDYRDEPGRQVLGATRKTQQINGVDFPISPAESQTRIHRQDREASLNEAHGVYRFASDHNLAGSTSTWCMVSTMLALVLARDAFETSLALSVATFFVTCAGK